MQTVKIHGLGVVNLSRVNTLIDERGQIVSEQGVLRLMTAGSLFASIVAYEEFNVDAMEKLMRKCRKYFPHHHSDSSQEDITEGGSSTDLDSDGRWNWRISKEDWRRARTCAEDAIKMFPVLGEIAVSAIQRVRFLSPDCYAQIAKKVVAEIDSRLRKKDMRVDFVHREQLTRLFAAVDSAGSGLSLLDDESSPPVGPGTGTAAGSRDPTPDLDMQSTSASQPGPSTSTSGRTTPAAASNTIAEDSVRRTLRALLIEKHSDGEVDDAALNSAVEVYNSLGQHMDEEFKLIFAVLSAYSEAGQRQNSDEMSSLAGTFAYEGLDVVSLTKHIKETWSRAPDPGVKMVDTVPMAIKTTLSRDINYAIFIFLLRGNNLSKILSKTGHDAAEYAKQRLGLLGITPTQAASRKSGTALGPKVVTLHRVAACFPMSAVNIWCSVPQLVCKLDMTDVEEAMGEGYSIPKAMTCQMFTSVCLNIDFTMARTPAWCYMMSRKLDTLIHPETKNRTKRSKLVSYTDAAFKSPATSEKTRKIYLRSIGLLRGNTAGELSWTPAVLRALQAAEEIWTVYKRTMKTEAGEED